jgi:hypothetical protein
MQPISISNKKILQFYEKNPNIDIESINLIFIDLFEKLFTDMNKTMNHTINNQILSTVTELQSEVKNIKQDMSLKLMESKREYLQEMNNIIQNIMHQNSDNVQNSLSQMNEKLIDKTKITLSEIIPKYSENTQKELSSQLSQLEKFMNEELSKIKPDDNNISSLLNNFESKFNSLILTVSNSSESRINETINSEKNLQQHFRNEMSLFMGEVTKNMNNQSEFFDKYKNSSLKGAFGENNLERILSSLYQTAEIVNTSKETASGDFMLKRVDESSIMIENKDYSRNVPIEEVRKFIRDIEVQKCHGIFLSQHSGITSKQNFQIETKGANIMVYIHNTNYCPQTIKTAIDIIDSLEDKLLDLKREPDEEVKLSMEQLQEINNEVRRFLDKKQTVLTMLKEMSSKIEKELKTFDLSCLVKTMNGIFGVMPEQPKVIICDICNSFQAQSNKSLAAHKRKCSKKIPS